MTPSRTYALSWIGTGLACLAVVLQAWVPQAVFIGLIAASLLCSGVVMLLARRRMKRAELELAMERAFGPGPAT